MDKPIVSQEYELLTEIAVAYYCDEITQEEIANKFGLSRIKVGRLLKRAKEEGIVEINVRYHPVFSTQLEKQLKERFPVSRALIALDHHDEEEQRRQVASLVSAYLNNVLKDNVVVAVGQGRNVASGRSLQGQFRDATVVLFVALEVLIVPEMSSMLTISVDYWLKSLAAAVNRCMHLPMLKTYN